jgi:hypothetical protein
MLNLNFSPLSIFDLFWEQLASHDEIGEEIGTDHLSSCTEFHLGSNYILGQIPES